MSICISMGKTIAKSSSALPQWLDGYADLGTRSWRAVQSDQGQMIFMRTYLEAQGGSALHCSRFCRLYFPIKSNTNQSNWSPSPLSHMQSSPELSRKGLSQYSTDATCLKSIISKFLSEFGLKRKCPQLVYLPSLHTENYTIIDNYPLVLAARKLIVLE